VGRKVLDDDCPGLAGQLAYFTLFSLFPFLLFLVALAGLVIDHPESVLRTLTERMQGLLPRDAVELLADYIDRTLRDASATVLFFGILATLWSGWAAADAMVKAINRAYELRETRPWWKLWGISLLMILGFMLVVATLAFVVFGPEVGGYVQSLTGLPDAFLALWGTLRWALAFLTVRRIHCHGTNTPLERGTEPLCGQLCPLQPDLRTGRGDHSADGLALQYGAYGAYRGGDQRRAGTHGGGA
jgi:membrane protein